MKVVSIILASITMLTALSTLVCALWISANKITDAGSLSFHKNCGIASVVLGVAACIFLIILAAKR
jgi:hypothetical protein